MSASDVDNGNSYDSGTPIFVTLSYPCSYELDTDMITHIEHGERLAIASLLDWGQQDGLVITTTMPTAGGEVRLVETRQLLAGGQEHTQVERYLLPSSSTVQYKASSLQSACYWKGQWLNQQLVHRLALHTRPAFRGTTFLFVCVSLYFSCVQSAFLRRALFTRQFANPSAIPNAVHDMPPTVIVARCWT